MRPRAALMLMMVCLCLLPEAAPAPPHLPDLVVDQQTLADSWTVERRFFTPASCQVVEGCVGGTGMRTLLRYDSLNVNISQNDLVLGDPSQSDLFYLSPCHGHYHLRDFNESTLLDLGGAPVAPGRKEGFCLVDTMRVVNESWVPPTGQFGTCENQGLTRGYGDIYYYCVECQWVDVTGVPPGDYQLRVTVNPTQAIRESNYANNSATVPVHLPDLSGQPDLIVDAGVLASSWRIDKRFFTAASCAFKDGCVGGQGYRRLLRFTTRTTNLGPNDLFAGDPTGDPRFASTQCHANKPFTNFAEYQLLDPNDAAVMAPRRQSVHLHDTSRQLSGIWTPRYPIYFACTNFCGSLCGGAPPDEGIARGFANEFDSGQDCQWLDVTGIPDGAYRLRVKVNPDGALTESNFANNDAVVPVTLSDPPGMTHRPDGRFIPGTPLDVTMAGGEVPGLILTYDVTFCPAADYNLYFSIQAPKFYTYTGAVCDLGTSGVAFAALPEPAPGEMVWFVVVGRDGAMEGGSGYDSAGRERPARGISFCGITASQATSVCN